MSDNKLADLLDQLDMESWLDYEGIRFKRTRGHNGVQLNVKECPVCGNHKWKVYLNAESGAGNCFVCESKFSKWSFIQSQLGKTGGQTFDYIKSYVESQFLGYGLKAEHAPAYVPPALQIPVSIELPYQGKTLKYLADRGVTPAMSAYYELRYCVDGTFPYIDGYGQPAEQNYSGRVLIPIRDINGALVSFQGRDITGKQEKKYLFPPGYSTSGSILYQEHRCYNANTVVITEGVFDCWATQAALDTEPRFADYRAVASFGKHLGPGQIEKLKELRKDGQLKDVVFLWDGEYQAICAAIDAALNCRGVGFTASVALLPFDCDPNEVDPKVVLQAIDSAEPINAVSAVSLKLKARKYMK